MEGKAKEAFDAWYIKKARQRPDIGERYFDEHLLEFLYNSGDTIKNAHIVEWFREEAKIHIQVYPNQSHFSFYPDVKFETLEELGSLRIAYSIRKFDEESYSAHESKRKMWQKKNHPEAYKERELLMESFKSNQRTVIHNFNPKYGNPQGDPETTK